MKTLISEIKELVKGTQINSYFCVQERNAPRVYANGFRFDIRLCDKSGEIQLTYWGGADEKAVRTIYDSFNEDDVIYVSGKIGEYRGKTIDVNIGGEIRQAKPEEYDLKEFIVTTNQDIDIMWTEVLGTKESLDNVYLKNLLNAFLNDPNFERDFKRAAGGKKIHHACCGGLLEHTWEVLRYCKAAAEVHPSLDKSLLYTGAILHDIGKIRAYDISRSIKISKEGMLTDHIFIATEQIIGKISQIPNFPETLKEKMIHMILSHHGKREYGTPVEPKFPEASALSCADLMGSQITQYIRAKKEALPSVDFKSGWNEQLESYVFLQ